MVERVGLVVDDVHVDGGRPTVVEVGGLTLKVAEIGVGVAIIVLVVGNGSVVGTQGEINHVLLGLRVPNGLGCPHTRDVGKLCAHILRGEMHGVVVPMDEVFRLHEHQSAVAVPSERTLHVGDGHVEPSILATQDVGVAQAAHDGGGVGLEERLSVVERRVVVAVLRDGVIEVLIVVAGEIHKEVVLIRLVLVDIDVEGLGLTQLSTQQGGREGDVVLLGGRRLQDAACVGEPLRIGRLPGDEGSHAAHGGQHQLVVEVVALVGQRQVLEVVGQALLLGEIGHDRHVERFLRTCVAQGEVGG